MPGSSSSSSSSCLSLLLSRLPLLRRRYPNNNKPKGDEEDPGQNWENILLFHILPNLPVKSLFRFKCVCKNWLRWISDDPYFIREQSRYSLASPCILSKSEDGGLVFFSTKRNPINVPDPSFKFLNGSKCTIEASCNGLLCVSFLETNYSRTFFVGNPVTEEWSLIPLRVNNYRGFFALAFDPLDSLPTYKLVNPRSNGFFDPGNELSFEVFSSDTGVWKVSGAKVTIKYCMVSLESVFNDGILYWTVDGMYILWFDLKEDLAGVLLPPGTDGFKHGERVLGVWEGKLSYTRIIGEKLVEAWTLIEFKWTRVYTMSLDRVMQGISDGLNLSQRRYEELVFQYQLGTFLYFTVRTYGGYEIICYDTKKGVVIESTFEKGYSLRPFFEYNNNFVRVPKLYQCVS